MSEERLITDERLRQALQVLKEYIDLNSGNSIGNGTGGISVGEGLLTSALTTTNQRTLELTAGNNVESGGGEYWFEATVNNADDRQFLASYVGQNISVSGQGFMSLNTFDYCYADSADMVSFYFSDYDAAENALNGIAGAMFSVDVTLGSTKSYPHQDILGEFNKVSNQTSAQNMPLLIVGNGTGTSNSARSNALRLTRNSQMYLGTGGKYNASGADIAEFMEWLDGNPDNEDRRGLFVTNEGGYSCSIASPDSDNIYGAVTRNASLIGNADEEWHGRWLRDDFGEMLYEEKTDEDGNKIMVPIQNPEYDPTQEYTPRAERKEWEVIGMLGVLIVRDDGNCQPGSYVTVGEGGIAVPASESSRHKFPMLNRISENVIRIFFWPSRR